MKTCHSACRFFFFNDTATTEIYTLSLHDALPIYLPRFANHFRETFNREFKKRVESIDGAALEALERSEEHTSELQSRLHLVCRLLLEKKKRSRHSLHLPQPVCGAAYSRQLQIQWL